MIQPLQKRQVLKKLTTGLPYDQQYHFWEYIQKNLEQDTKEIICTPVLVTTLCTRAKKWKESNPNIHGQIIHFKNVVYK